MSRCNCKCHTIPSTLNHQCPQDCINTATLDVSQPTIPNTELREMLDRLFHAGWSAHKASFDSRNSKGIRRIEEAAIEDAYNAIQARLSEAHKGYDHYNHTSGCLANISQYCTCGASVKNEQLNPQKPITKEETM